MNKIILTLLLIILTVYAEEQHQEISQTDSPIRSIKFCTQDGKSYIALTNKGSTYSIISGVWQNMDEMLERQALLQTQDIEKNGHVFQIHQNPHDLNMNLLQGSKNVYWLTIDCGRSVTAVRRDYQLMDFQYHPKRKDYILASESIICSSKDNDCFDYKNLLISKDYGRTWNILWEYVEHFTWIGEGDSILAQVNDKVFTDNKSNFGTGSIYKLYRSDDFFKDDIELIDNCISFKVIGRRIYLTKIDEENDIVKLFVHSIYPQSGESRLFKISDNDETQDIQSYNLLDDDSHRVLIYASKFSRLGDRLVGIIFLADYQLNNIKVSLEFVIDQNNFKTIAHFPKVHIANVVRKAQANQYLNALQYFMEEGYTNHEQLQKAKEDMQSKIGTVISFDDGQTWNTINASQCLKQGAQNCALFLHIVGSSQIPPFYSPNHAPGILLAVGNVGKSLSFNQSELATFLSSDSGQSWQLLRENITIYEVSQTGDAIIVADYGNDIIVQKVYVTYNFGSNWIEIELEVPIIVTNIINKRKDFIIYGTDKNGEGQVLVVEAPNEDIRDCLGTQGLSTEAMDFTVYTEDECRNGEKVRYIIKTDSECRIQDLNRTFRISESCQCSLEDYECAPGFSYKDGYCEPAGAVIDQDTQCQNQSFYIEKSGYQKRLNNQCKLGVSLDNEKVKCSNIWNRVYFLLSLGVIMVIFFIRRDYKKELMHENIRRQQIENRDVFEEETLDL